MLAYRRGASNANEHVDRLVASHAHEHLLLLHPAVLSDLLLQIPLVGAGIPLKHVRIRDRRTKTVLIRIEEDPCSEVGLRNPLDRQAAFRILPSV